MDALEGSRGAESIFQIGAGPSPSEAARWAIDPYDADRRYRGTLLLANAQFGGDEVYLQLFQDALRDPAPNVRAAGVRGLAHHGRPEHVAQLLPMLKDDEARVRLETVRALQRLHDPAAVPGLVQLLDLNAPLGDQGLTGPAEPTNEIRSAAADALGQYPEPRVFLALLGALGDPDLIVNRNAARSLETLTGQEFGLDRRAWGTWYAEAGGSVFAGRTAYLYPAFERDRKIIEYLPFLPQPPNEPSARPVGMPPLNRQNEPGLGPEPRTGSAGDDDASSG